MIVGAIIDGVVGIITLVLGLLIWLGERISLLHGYHYDCVKDEDKKAFCTLMGAGVSLLGISLIISAILLLITHSVLSFLGVGAGFAIGLPPIIYAENKYNK